MIVRSALRSEQGRSICAPTFRWWIRSNFWSAFSYRCLAHHVGPVTHERKSIFLHCCCWVDAGSSSFTSMKKWRRAAPLKCVSRIFSRSRF